MHFSSNVFCRGIFPNEFDDLSKNKMDELQADDSSNTDASGPVFYPGVLKDKRGLWTRYGYWRLPSDSRRPLDSLASALIGRRRK